MLINRLLMACGRRHFEARQRPEAPEYWRHFSVSGWHEVCRAHTKTCKQQWAKNYSRTIRHYLNKNYVMNDVQLYQFEPEGTWQEEDHSKLLGYNHSRETINRIRLDSTHVMSEHFSFLLPTFQSDLQCSHNGIPPVIWILSLYLYQVYFAIIILEFLVTVLSITYFKNIFWGWNVPLSRQQN